MGGAAMSGESWVLAALAAKPRRWDGTHAATKVWHFGCGHLCRRERVEGGVYHWGALPGSLPVAVRSFFVEYRVSGLTGAVKE